MPDKKASLDPDQILSAEFNYIANSAFQANEDRSRAASFFLLSVGSLVAAIFGAGGADITNQTYLVLAGLFLFLTLLGALTVVQLARLRIAWHESARAMNQIKDYYMANLKSAKLEQAFRWRTENLPPRHKPESISYATALEVSMLSGLTFGASAYFIQLGLIFTQYAWAWSLAFGLAIFLFEMYLYRRILVKGKAYERKS